MYWRTMEVGADLGEETAQGINGRVIKHSAAIFRHKDQVGMQLENAVPSASNSNVITYRSRV